MFVRCEEEKEVVIFSTDRWHSSVVYLQVNQGDCNILRATPMLDRHLIERTTDTWTCACEGSTLPCFRTGIAMTIQFTSKSWKQPAPVAMVNEKVEREALAFIVAG